MSEVKRYTFKGAAGEYVYSKDFDRVTAERDAALGREKECQRQLGERWKDIYALRDTVEAHSERLTAADEREDLLESALREICNTSISADHAKLQALGMREVAQAALGAEKSTPDFSMIGTDKMPPMEYDEP